MARTLQDVIPDKNQRDQIIAHMLNQRTLVNKPIGVLPFKQGPYRSKTLVFQHLRIPKHGKCVELLAHNDRNVHKQVIKPWTTSS